jgi:hypothetical protein
MQERNRSRLARTAVTGALVLGLAAGSYGVATAASGNDNSQSMSTSQSAPPSAQDPQNPWGPQRSDETPLTGDTLASVKAAAMEKVPAATIIRIETDADGNAAYEAHLVKPDGTAATVYVDKQFNVVGVDTR